MRLVEVVVLMGAHCVSPVEHTQLMTEVAKVQCAVVIEKDTETGTAKVTPQAAAADPQMVAAIARFDAAVTAQNGAGTRIVPAFAPAGQSPTEIKPPPALPSAAAAPPVENTPAPAPVAEVPAPATEAAPPDAESQSRAVAAKPVDRQAPAATPKKRQVAKADPPAADPPKAGSQCKGAAVPKWYKGADGHRKYRCVRPVPAGDAAPNQLY